MSSLWLLEAKAYPADDRTEAATAAKFWLRPGSYTVGRAAGQCDIDAVEDKSISRTHAHVVVPSVKEWEEQGTPHVTIMDSSRYGTLVTDKNDLAADGPTGLATRAYDHWLIRFGFKSPFKLNNQGVAVLIHPTSWPELHAAAAAAGIPEVTNFDSSGVRLVMPAAEAQADGLVVAALVRGCPIVAASWLEQWGERKVWKGSCPQEEDHPVKVLYVGKQGGQRTLVGADAPLAARASKLMAGTTLVWRGAVDAQDDALQQAAALASAVNLGWPVSKAMARRIPAGAAVVLAAPRGGVPSGLEGHPWTTAELLMAGLLEGSMEGVVHPPSAGKATPEVTPPKDRVGAAKEPPGGASVEAGGWSSARRDGQKGGASAEPPAPAAAAAAEPPDSGASVEPSTAHQGGRKRKGGPAAAAAPAGANDGAAAEVGQTPSKRRRAGKEPAHPPRQEGQARVQAASAPPQPAAGGWHVRQRRALAPGDEAIEDSDAEEMEEENRGAEGAGRAAGGPSTISDITTTVTFATLIVPSAAPTAAATAGGAYSGPNFKAFRRKGAAAPLLPAAPLVRFDPEPYREGVADGEEFMREEEEAQRHRDIADKVFNATVKPKRGKAGAEASQQSLAEMLGKGARKAPSGRGKARGRAK